MTAAIDASLREIAATVSEDLGGVLKLDSLRWSRPPSEALVVDATLALLIDGHRARDHSVLLVSNPQFPNAISEAVSHAKSVAERLNPDTASHVMLPRCTGRHEGQSYALYSRLTPMSDNRLLRLVQKNVAAPRVARWLQDVALQSRQTALTPERVETVFRAPLNSLQEEPELPDTLRRFAGGALDRIEQDNSHLFTIIEHADFWYGNALFDPALIPGVTGTFRVIDWGGARLDGYAGIDLLRYCRSCFRPGARQTRHLMSGYLAALDIPQQEAGLHPMAALGRLGLNLDQFPKARYIALAQDIFALLTENGLIPD